MPVPAWLPRAAAAHPDRPAINALTYSALLTRVEATPVASEAAASGTEDFAVALHAALLANVPFLPLDPRLAGDELALRRRLAPPGDPSSAPRGFHDLDAVALRIFTSGTSSATPKPVALTYGNLMWSAFGSAVALGLDPAERWLCVLPLAHVGGLQILVRSAIYGTSVILHPSCDAHRVRAALEDDGVTLVSLVPTMLARLLDAGLREPPHLRHALIGGAPLAPALRARAEEAGIPVAETYGMTETASQVVTEGRPLLGTSVELAEDDEIVVSGPTVAGGGPLATGDLGAWTEDGRLQVRGRKADTIVTGGENVAPQEVEEVLLEHPGVRDVAVVGRRDPEWGEALVALVVPGTPQPTAEELRGWVGERLARFKVPKDVEWAAELPRNAAGKLERRTLRP